jgi:cellulose synthase/poly-beta-1,6-N-acetylglucosamine synthase-like glycosyltransferase
VHLLSAVLLLSVLLLVPATVLVFTVGTGPGAPMSFVRALGAAVGVALTALAAGALLQVGPVGSGVAAVVMGASVLAWTPLAGPWAVRGLVAWALTLVAGTAYLLYVLAWTFTSDLSPLALVSSLLLWVLEVFVFAIGVAYVWEFVDVVGRRVWPAKVDTRALSAADKAHRPFVSLHVPTHNEPPDMVIETLQRLLELDYEDYEVLLVDNNTSDPALWRPVEAFCAQHERLAFLHLEDWPGYKSGALNHALTVTDDRAEIIGIVDADYLVAPDFLAACAPLFADPTVSFVQTPQDYRDWQHAPYFRRLYHSYAYFFDVSQRSRNERNGAIFGGTMGLIRRSALTGVGGWDEWCITEDAELSLRMLKAGGKGVHVDEAFGQGVMPLTFEALKRQRFRWCFGGIQILRMHGRALLPGRVTAANRLTSAQRWAYFSGGLQWFGDLAGVLFTAFLLLGAVDAISGDGVVIRRLAGIVLLSVVVLLVLGVLRALALVNRTSGAGWRESGGAFLLWVSLALTVAQASARGLFAKQGAFLRTPKVRGELGWRDAVRGNRVETGLAIGCLATGAVALTRGTFGASVVGGLLLVQGLGYGSALVNSIAAIRSDLPEDLRRRRLLAGSWERLAAPARRGGLVLALAGSALAGFVALASPVGSPDLTEIPQRAEDSDEAPSERPTPVRTTPSDTPAGTQATTPATTQAGTPTTGTSGPGGASTAPTAGAPTGAPTGPPTAVPTGPATTPSGPPTTPSQATSNPQPTQATQPSQATAHPSPTHPSPTRATQGPGSQASPSHPTGHP